jgi:predicted nucleic acid-binding protein
VDYLVDTNVLLRALSLGDPRRKVARKAVRSLLTNGAQLCVASQNIVEFWNVCTRPKQNNGFGKTVGETDRYCRFAESFLTVLPDTPEVYANWRSIVVDHKVHGLKVHDARLYAAMKVHRVPRILTFNVHDFVRFDAIVSLHPQDVF